MLLIIFDLLISLLVLYLPSLLILSPLFPPINANYTRVFQHRMGDWAQREAFLELRRREALGLPPIDANLVEEDKIELPSDEELDTRNIII